MSDQGESTKSVTERRLAAGEQPTLLASASQPPPDDWVGREISGRYRVLERIGEGGMGVVYVAEHLHLKKRVAFKVIHADLAANEELLLRFKREALATGQLDHPHIAAAIDFDLLPSGVAFIVMPLVRGHSLQVEVDRSGALDFRRACRLGAQIADALSAAHTVGIVHRDLKPDNVLLETRSDGSESCTVLDFGVASLTGRAERISLETSKALTRAGTILGTPGYMSPEQATAGDIDHRTDLYALGVMLWELCRGERLFAGDDVTAIFAKQFNAIPPALAVGTSQPATELSQLVQRLLSWNKQDRPDSATEVRDALRRIAELPDAKSWTEHPLFNVKHVGPIVGFLLVVGAISLLFSGDDAEPSPAVQVTAAEATKPTHGKSTKLTDGARVNRGAPNPPADLRSAMDDLFNSSSESARRDAARLIRRKPGQAPRFAEFVADLELAARCPQKKTVVEDMRGLGDPRVLPALQRLADAPRRGCGLLRLNDCYWCLRHELEETIASLEAVGK